ncbi:MAG: hypothetical protein JO112_08795 [Planctomycetes bacterium]|nr:hypothetical protein [Planctomycetota bacterium]
MVFDEGGLRFQYPDNWRLEREDNDTGWTVSIQSPDTAFVMISLREDMPSVEELAETALAALREDYPDLEADECTDSLAGQPAVGHDIQFFSFDLTNTCWTRSFYSPQGTVFVLCQTNDLELADHEPILKAICKSLHIEDE